jgi:MFS family permease
MAGVCLSLAYLSTAAGVVGGGWFSDRFRRRKIPALTAGLVSIPFLWLMGQATTLWVLAAALAVWFFCAGLSLALVNIAAGLSAEEGKRGKVSGILALTTELGALFGGGLAGPIVDRWGYATMYTVLSLVGILAPLAALLWEEQGTATAPGPKTDTAKKGAGVGRSFHFLFVASLGAAVAGFVFFLGRSFVMTDLGFDTAALSSTGAIGGAIALPAPLLAGWLSDRLGRKRLVVFSFLATTAGLLALCASTALWHFWLASMLYTLSFAGGPVGSAMVTDLVPREALGRGLALYNATTWLGGIVGCMLTGYAAQSLGTTPTLIAGVFLPLLAAGLLVPIGRYKRAAVEASSHKDTFQPVEPLPARMRAVPTVG